MGKAVYWQNGESLDYRNTTDERIEAGTILPVGTRLGVAACSIAPGETGTVAMEGVFECQKTGTAEILMGAYVYFDGTGITDAETGGEAEDASGYIRAGYAAETAAANAGTVKVKLLG